MKTILFSAALFLAGTLTLHAQIGGTLDECTQHYGRPVKGPDPTDGSCAFLAGKIFIEVLFTDGKADYLMFGKKGLGNRGEIPLSNTEISALMTSNAGGHRWLQNTDPTAGGGWVTDDGQIFAARLEPAGGLVIETKDRKDRDAAAKSKPAKTL